MGRSEMCAEAHLPVREEEPPPEPGVDGLAGDAFHALQKRIVDCSAAELIYQFVVIDYAHDVPRRHHLFS